MFDKYEITFMVIPLVFRMVGRGADVRTIRSHKVIFWGIRELEKHHALPDFYMEHLILIIK